MSVMPMSNGCIREEPKGRVRRQIASHAIDVYRALSNRVQTLSTILLNMLT